MKYCLLFIIIFYGFNIKKDDYSLKSEMHSINGILLSQKDPFYFLNSVPSKVKLLGKLDLSFFRNQLIVIQYRYRIEIPKGVESGIDRNLIKWSSWINNDLTPVIIPSLDQEGGYKLIIEYRTSAGKEIQRFERIFYVYKPYPLNIPIATGNKVPAVTSKSERKSSTVVAGSPAAKPVAEFPAAASASSAKPADNTSPVSINSTKTRNASPDKQMDLKNLRISIHFLPEVESVTANPVFEKSNSRNENTDKASNDGENSLAKAIENSDTSQISELIKIGAGSGLKDKNGGSIFHLLNGSLASEYLISTLKTRGFSINATDNFGNTPLHKAIISGDSVYVRSLINQGSDLNLKNNIELAPLHLAVFLNNRIAVKELLLKNADINSKGNTGYTPLHIAAEKNYSEITLDLLSGGAREKIKTSQGLTAKTIAKIQNNVEILQLFTGEYDSASFMKLVEQKKTSSLNTEKQSTFIDFNLPYDQKLSKKRQLSNFIQILTIPVFTISTAFALYFKTEANKYYELSRIAETEEMAKIYYDKMTRYDNSTYISAGISIVSVYGFIHSTLKKKNVSRKMIKTLN